MDKEFNYYQKLVDGMDYASLPSIWQFDASYSSSKKLYDYQENALRNAVKFLKYFYHDVSNERNDNKKFIKTKKAVYNDLLKYNKDIKNLKLSNKNNDAVNDILNYYDYETVKNEKVINFCNFVNRMSFWMATGSGKTLVIIKLIEILHNLINNKLIPDNDILLMTYREDLINQINKQIDDYNSYHDRKIHVYLLKDYDKVKTNQILYSKDDINIFLYRSDLISDETKEKQLSYKDIENYGKWYIILDEAHKGKNEDSKRQVYYDFMTRFGFLFNFSATFVDTWDIITTVYNFNLDEFIKAGYGKNVYVSQKNINNIREFDETEREKIILKTLIMLTGIKKSKEKLKNFDLKYHNPLMVIYGNSVNTDEADLELIFKTLERIAKSGNVDIFAEALRDIIDEINYHSEYVFGKDELFLDQDLFNSINEKDILKQIFNSDTNGAIEVLKLPSNKQELIFKLKTSDKPFALIKMMDITKWVKEKLKSYEIIESYENKSYFDTINEESSDINILLGSRTFYEGWDSNRPNVIVYINIGTGNESKKFILQSIGRGERIEPLNNERKRLDILSIENVKAKSIYDSLSKEEKRCINLIESSFIFGTDVDNIKKIMKTIRFDRSSSGYNIELKKNDDIDDDLLFVPVYEEKTMEVEDIPKFNGNYDLINNYIKWISDNKILYAIYSDYIEPSGISELNNYINNEDNFKRNFKNTYNKNVNNQIIDLIYHLNEKYEKFKDFKKLEEEIIHFKQIKGVIDNAEYQKIENIVKNVSGISEIERKRNELLQKVRNGEIDDNTFKEEYNKINWFDNTQTDSVEIKNVANHYYIPVLISKDYKTDIIEHIITEKSEKNFLNDLEKYTKDIKFNFDFWFFSKIDETTDKVYIPYYDRENNRERKFYPDFIFWIKIKDDYHIVFVDPKSPIYTDYEYKIEGYANLYEENNKPKRFRYNNLNIYVYLSLYTDDKDKIPKKWQKYWHDNPESIFKLAI